MDLESATSVGLLEKMMTRGAVLMLIAMLLIDTSLSSVTHRTAGHGVSANCELRLWEM